MSHERTINSDRMMWINAAFPRGCKSGHSDHGVVMIIARPPNFDASKMWQGDNPKSGFIIDKAPMSAN